MMIDAHLSPSIDLRSFFFSIEAEDYFSAQRMQFLRKTSLKFVGEKKKSFN